MSSTSLADLKRKQQLRKQQQHKQNKRKREAATATAGAVPSQSTLDNHFHRSASTGHSSSSLPKRRDKLHNHFQRAASLNLASSILAAAPETKAPFATAPPKLKQNPFDIINELEAEENGLIVACESGDIVVVGASGDLSDSEDDGDEGADPALGPVALSSDEEMFENDPSLYKVSARSLPLHSSTLLRQTPMGDDASSKSRGMSSTIRQGPHPAVRSDLALSHPEKYSSDKPLQTLSLRTHVSASSSQPLKELERLKDDGSLLSMTSLCSPGSAPLNLLADALVYWEIIGATDPRQQGTLEQRPSASIASAGQIQQAFVSLFRLQLEAPAKYPFIYLQTRDYTVVFRMNILPDTSGTYRRDAIVSQSSLGLRKTLHAEGVEFSVPLAPKTQDWSEIPGAISTDTDTHFLRTTLFDKTWKSALLITNPASVNGLFSHLYSLPLGAAKIFASGPFLNATMRRQTVRISSVVSYEDGVEKILNKLDINGVILPNMWNTVLTSLAEVITDGFHATSKESADTASLTMLIAAGQNNAAARRRGVTFADGKYTYS
ncbi:hypothetical protein EC988_003103 [Linderina pennispora]|nr:hypothetical protein EC988_003103 [Linderina pennispora]